MDIVKICNPAMDVKNSCLVYPVRIQDQETVKKAMASYSADSISLLPNEKQEGEKYKCVSCDEEVIANRGELKRWHFSHKKNTKCEDERKKIGCGGESFTHKIAKNMLYQWLLNRRPFSVRIKTPQNDSLINIEYNEDDIPRMEFSLKDGGRADLVLLNKNKDIKYIFEICHTSRTKSRPEPWFEFDASETISKLNTSPNTKLILDDIRKNLYNRGGSDETKKDVHINLSPKICNRKKDADINLSQNLCIKYKPLHNKSYPRKIGRFDCLGKRYSKIRGYLNKIDVKDNDIYKIFFLLEHIKPRYKIPIDEKFVVNSYQALEKTNDFNQDVKEVAWKNFCVDRQYSKGLLDKISNEPSDKISNELLCKSPMGFLIDLYKRSKYAVICNRDLDKKCRSDDFDCLLKLYSPGRVHIAKTKKAYDEIRNSLCYFVE